uniref:DNA damage-binding protein 1 n=1 Tax=Auxenochlorella protothecoides TaxID=3075 RepID=A0A1D1ZT42_AUXPR
MSLPEDHRYNYVVTAQKPSSVRHSVVGCFTAPGAVNLIVSKCTRLEISVITADGLQGVMDVPIYGRISALRLFAVAGEETERLFLLTEKNRFAILKCDPATGELQTCANGDASDRIGRPVQSGQMCIVSPKRDAIVLHLYDGHLKIIPVSPSGVLSEAYNVRIDELNLVDLVFLDAEDFEGLPTIAVLYDDGGGHRHAKTYSLSLPSRELLQFRWAQENLDAVANLLIPIPGTDGVVVVGQSTVCFLAHNAVVSASIPSTIVKAYGAVDREGTRFLLGDFRGELLLLVLERNGPSKSVTGLHIERLGRTSQPSTISYLDAGVVYIGSACGDSQLIRLHAHPPDPSQPDSFLEVLDTTTNLGPIVDFCVVDLDRQGQGQVVTCSGGAGDGSLRIVRSGIGVLPQATVELPSLKGVWNLRRSFEDEHDAFLVLGFVESTSVLGMNAAEEIEEVGVPGFDDRAQTLWSSNLLGSLVVQVTPAAVNVADTQTLQRVSQWTPPEGSHIIMAAANATQMAVVTGVGRVVLLELKGSALEEAGQLALDSEIACIDLSPLKAGATASDWLVLGTWSMHVLLYSLPGLQLATDEALGGEVIPRSILLSQFEDSAYVFCGLGDGHLVNYRLHGDQLGQRKKLALGTKPMKLRALRSRGVHYVFCASDRPTIIYANNQKLVYSNLNESEVNFMVSFHTEAIPHSLALAKDNDLTIGIIDEIQKLHIQTVPLEEQPRRIAHQPATRTYGVITTQATMGMVDAKSDSLRLIDDQTFETLDRYQMPESDMACSLLSTTLGETGAGPYYIVGTATTNLAEREPTEGRIMVFEAVEGKLHLVYTHETRGAVYVLHPFLHNDETMLVAGINSRVQMYRWEVSAMSTASLMPHCSYDGNVLILFLDSRKDLVILGDLMKSMQVLQYSSEEGKLLLRARDFRPMWMTAVKAMDDDTYIGGENSCNIFVVHKGDDAAPDEERTRLEVIGQYHVGEFINRFQKGSLVMKLPDSELSQAPLMLFGTINGVIGLIASLSQDQFQFLERLEAAMLKVVKGVGGLDHGAWRSFVNTHTQPTPACGFVDGDLVEQFLDLSRGDQEIVCSHLGGSASLEQVQHLVEDLSRLH